MGHARGAAVALALGASLLLAGPAVAEPLPSIEEAYAARQLRRTPFDPRAAAHLAPEESRFLEDLFALTDEAARLNVGVLRWLLTDGARGSHVAAHLQDVDTLRTRIDGLDTPERLASVRTFVSDSLGLQRRFMADWSEALEEGRPFESQLSNEFAYHEGLHRSHRLLLKAFAELHALLPDAGEAVHRSFHDHLRAMDLK